MKIEFNPQKNISLLQDGRRFVVYSCNMAALMSCEHTLLNCHERIRNLEEKKVSASCADVSHMN